MTVKPEDVKAVWEERFEKKYGFWRGFVDAGVARHREKQLEPELCGRELAERVFQEHGARLRKS